MINRKKNTVRDIMDKLLKNKDEEKILKNVHRNKRASHQNQWSLEDTGNTFLGSVRISAVYNYPISSKKMFPSNEGKLKM